MKSPQALVAFADPEQQKLISVILSQCGFSPVIANSLKEVIAALAQRKLSLIFCGRELPDGTFHDVLVAAQRTEKVPVVVASRTAGWEEYFTALQQGAFDLIATPCRADEVRHVVSQLPRRLSAA